MKGCARARGKVVFVLGLVLAQQSVSQLTEHAPSTFSVSVGLGAGLHSTPYLVDYINAFGQTSDGKRLDEFSSMLELFVAPAMRIDPEWDVALEYSLLVKSQTVGNSSTSSGSEFTYNVHMPTAMVHYVVDGLTYFVRFGGGLGYHMATMRQVLHVYGVQDDFTASGPGIKLEAVGNTKFDDTFYGSIGADVRWGFLGAFKNSAGVVAYDRTTNTTAKMQFFSLSLKFGVLFQL